MRNIDKMEENNSQARIKGAIMLTMSVIIVKIIGFIYKLPLSYILGDEGMGFFNSAYTVFGFFYLLCTGGVPRAVSIITAGESNSYKLKKILRYSLSFFSFIGVAFSLTLLCFSDKFSTFIGNDLARFSLISIAPSLTFVAASGVLRGYLNGRSSMGAIAISEIIECGIKFVMGLALALYASSKKYSPSIISAYTVLGVTLGSFVGALFLYICAKSLKNQENIEQNINIEVCLSDVIKSIIRIGLPITVSSFISGLYGVIDLSLLVNGLVKVGFSENEAIAFYGNYSTLVMPMLTLASALLAPISTAWLPKMAQNAKEGKTSVFSLDTEHLLSMTSALAIPLSCIFFFFSREILTLLFQYDSALKGFESLILISPSIIFLPLLTAINASHEAARMVKYPLLALSTGVTLKFFFEYLFLYHSHLGIKAAPISTNIGYAASLLISLICISKKLKVSINVFSSLFVPFTLSVVSYFVAKLLSQTLFSDFALFFNIVASVSFGSLAYILLNLIFRRNFVLDIFDFVEIHKNRKKNYVKERKKH